MSYIPNIEALAGRRCESSQEDELTEFVVSRLAELVVVLFNDHIGSDAAAQKDRAEGRVVLSALGDLAAENGRADLMAVLYNLATKIEDRPKAEPVLKSPLRCRVRFTHHW